MKTISALSFLFIVLFALKGYSQPDSTVVPYVQNDDARGYFRIMFYNTENFFDTFDDPEKSDEQFTPDGEKHWTSDKYRKKLMNICRVIVAVGGWEPPEVVGFCEVENLFCLEELVDKTPLSNLGYKIVHHESPDNRGIDVALLYRPEKFTVLNEYPIKVVFPFDANKPTRDILYVEGVTTRKDTLHIFVNHWPSRWGGEMETEDKRIHVATIVRHHADSILSLQPNANIIIMGDLNDHIDNQSVKEYLKANLSYDNINNKELYNLTARLQEEEGKGSHKYEGEWGILDHIIVSGALIGKKNTVYSEITDAQILDAAFLLERDEQNVGYRPFRTYIGFRFHGGYSDHLPVYLDIRKN